MLSVNTAIRRVISALLFATLPLAATAEPDVVAFGVLNQRSITQTAQFWNPILAHISKASGVPLELRMGRTAPETTSMTVRGEFGFAYTNHLFTPERVRLGYRVIARPDTPPIRSQIIVREDSDIRSVAGLAGKTIVFPSHEAFVGYQVPMDHLTRQKIDIKAVFASNQEGAMAQLKNGAAMAAAVNDRVLATYAAREGLRYRVLWASDSYLDLPIMANPALPSGQVERVRRAFSSMADTVEGRTALGAAKAAIGYAGDYRFVAATDQDYESYRRFHANTVLRQR